LSAAHSVFQQGPHPLLPQELSQLSDAYQLVSDMAGLLEAPSVPSVTSFLDILFDAFVAMDESFRERSAVEWADGFTIPVEAVSQDTADLLRHSLNVKNFIKEKRSSTSPHRLSIERITEVLGPQGGAQLTDPMDLVRIHNLTRGMQIPTAPDFKPLSSPPP
jgi:hypothetical protein